VIGAQSGLDRQAAARTVDRALALSAGAGYVNGSPLSRAYRDVKAGSFMHPLGANRAYDYLARVALGEQASLQRAFPSHERGRLRGGADDARCGRAAGVRQRAIGFRSLPHRWRRSSATSAIEFHASDRRRRRAIGT
jgi:hypothetical protein